MFFLVQHHYLHGEETCVEAMGWAEDRREELVLRQKEQAVTGGGAAAQEEMLVQNVNDLVSAVKQELFLMKIGLVLLSAGFAVAILKK